MSIRDLFGQNKDQIYDKGIVALKMSNFTEAIEHFSKVINLDPSDAPAHYNLGCSYFETGNYTGAIEHFSTYIKLTPSDPTAYYRLGAAYAQSNNYEAAANNFREYTKLARDDVDESLLEYINVLEDAGRLSILGDTGKAKQVLTDYIRKKNIEYQEVTIDGEKINYFHFLENVDILIHKKAFQEAEIVKELFDIIHNKVILSFYALKKHENILDPKDAFGFGIAFTLTGYAIACVSKDFLGQTTYIRNLSRRVVDDLRSKAIPKHYDMGLLIVGNPIPWKFINRVIENWVGRSLEHFLDKLPWAIHQSGVIREHIIREFILLGYYIGIWENAGGSIKRKFEDK